MMNERKSRKAGGVPPAGETREPAGIVNAAKNHKLCLLNVHDYTDIGFGEKMIRRYSAYYEIHVAEVVGGAAWMYCAKIMDRAIGSGVLEEASGVEPTEEDARRASQTWVRDHMEAYRLPWDPAEVEEIKRALAVLRGQPAGVTAGGDTAT